MGEKKYVQNRYELGDLLGKGGMGRVYRGFDTQTGKPVAIKVLRSDMVAGELEAVERFTREAEALRALDHPNIVKVYASVEESGGHYLVMEFVHGESLADLITRERQLKVDRTLEIGLDIADALTRAHRLGIIHRDLKPANVLISEDGSPRLSDFGLARIGDSKITQVGTLMGSPAYLSPELCQGEAADARADIWAFGVMLFEMLTGQLPFEAENFTGILMAILNKPVPDLDELRPEVPPGLMNLIYRMLEKDSRVRMPSVRLVGAELEALLSGADYLMDQIHPLLVKDSPIPAAPKTEWVSQSPQSQTKGALLRIQTLGIFQVGCQGKVLTWPTQKCKALFQILLIEPGRLVATDQILEFLWPDLEPEKGTNNLWVTVSQLRRILEPDSPPRDRTSFVLKQGEGYRFNSSSSYWLDGEEFAAYLAKAHSATDPNSRISAWESARALYQGEFLEDEPYAEWAQFPRTQWHRRYIQLLLNLAKAYWSTGRNQQAITNCREILRLDNTNEAAYRTLMRCYASIGDRTSALKVYDEANQILRDEIGVEPMSETTELAHQIKLPEERWKFTPEIELITEFKDPIPFPFVGRKVEMEALTRSMTMATAGHGQISLVIGEAGIGKTRLVQEFAMMAQRQGFDLLTARCNQVEKTIPYQRLIDLLTQVMAGNDYWKNLNPIWLRELAVMVPDMGKTITDDGIPDHLPVELDENRQGRLFQAITNLFIHLSSRRKIMLLIEDIHWSDPATLLCLHYLAFKITQVPMVILLTLRSEGLSTDADLTAMVHSIRRESHVTFLSIERLKETDTTSLLEQTSDTAHFADQIGRWLHNETDGIPFYLVSLLQSLREDGLLKNGENKDWQALASSDPRLTVPDAIKDLVLERVQRTREIEREVLEWMAVYGRRLNFSTLQAISNQPQMTLLNAVEELAARQLLVETSRHIDFNHSKIREVMYQNMSSARRALYHKQIAVILEKLPPAPDKAALLAYHFERAGEQGKAFTYWMQAGEKSIASYANQQAANHYERALALADQAEDQMDAYLGLGYSLSLQDEHRAAKTLLMQGLQLAERQTDEARRVRLLHALAQNANRQHRSDGGKPEARIALDAAEQAGDDYHLAQSLLLLTEAHESNGDLGSALDTAKRAQEVISRLDDSRLEARTLLELGFLNAQRSDFNEAVKASERGLALLVKTEDRDSIAYAWNILGRGLGGRGDYSRALDAFHHSQQEAQIVGDRFLLAQASNMLGWLYRELGDYGQALKFDQEGVELSRRWGKPSPEISAHLNLCLDMLHMGDPERSLMMLDEIEAQIKAGSYGFHNWRWRLRLLHARGMCFLALGNPEKIKPLVGEGLPLAEKIGIRKYIALNHELSGLAFVDLNRSEEAISELETAISLADTIQYQPTRWASRHRLSNLLYQKGRDQEAEQTKSEAVEIIQSIASTLEDENLRAKFFKTALL